LYRVFNDDYDYDYDYTPPPSSLVDEIQAQHQLPTPAGVLSAPALQVWAEGAGVDDNAAQTHALRIKS
jgi:hypothetical protein